MRKLSPLLATTYITRTSIRTLKRKRDLKNNEHRVAQAAQLETEDAAFEADNEDEYSHEVLIRVPYCRLIRKFEKKVAQLKKTGLEEREEKEERPWDKDYPVPTVGERKGEKGVHGVDVGIEVEREDDRAVVEEKSGNRVEMMGAGGWTMSWERYEPCKKGFFEEVGAPKDEAVFWGEDNEGRKREEFDRAERWEWEWKQVGVACAERDVDQGGGCPSNRRCVQALG